MTGERFNILLVDEDSSLRALAGAILAHEGWRVDEAASLDQALRALGERSVRPHVALVDAVLLDGSARRFEADLQRSRSRAQMLYMTGDSRSARHLTAGAGHVLCKPFTPNELVRAVRRALEAVRPVAVAVEAGSVYRRLMRFALENAGYALASAGSLEEGLRLVMEQDARLLLTPEPAGELAFQQLMDVRRQRPDLIVIAVDAPGATARGWSDRTLAKPYSAQVVMEVTRLAPVSDAGA
jgi:DNA-binding response OmpR family regulator